MARPTLYSEELTDIICDRLTNGESLNKICKDEGMPARRSVLLWLDVHPEFSRKYARARDHQADYFAEEIVDIAGDEKDPAIARNKIDARKWFASKTNRVKWGDKTTVETEKPIEVNVTHDVNNEVARKIAFAIKLAAQAGPKVKPES